jgi:hypothetical protein
MTFKNAKGDKFDFVYRRFVKQDEGNHTLILTSQGLEAAKFKGASNKRLKIDSWSFVFENLGGNSSSDDEQHARIFCHMQVRHDKIKEVMAPLMMQLIENAVISIE